MKRDLHAESNKLQDTLCGYPGIRHTTADTKLVRQLLLDTEGQMLVNGRLWTITTKHIGAGVHRVQLTEQT